MGAKTTLHQFVERIIRLEGQNADADCIGQYVRRWWSLRQNRKAFPKRFTVSN
ncbi:MAG: hypothetical protein VSS75_021100 [Candidatus Parabeggiatoa sp.]|nr:hypothetical protein [Candidatus Parabeggiatoa sp.]